MSDYPKSRRTRLRPNLREKRCARQILCGAILGRVEANRLIVATVKRPTVSPGKIKSVWHYLPLMTSRMREATRTTTFLIARHFWHGRFVLGLSTIRPLIMLRTINRPYFKA